MGVGGQQAKWRKVGLRFPFSGVSAYRSPERDTTTSQRMRGVRQEEVAVCESFGSRVKRQEDVTYGKYIWYLCTIYDTHLTTCQQSTTPHDI
jgi:hypothetical protein